MTLHYSAAAVVSTLLSALSPFLIMYLSRIAFTDERLVIAFNFLAYGALIANSAGALTAILAQKWKDNSLAIIPGASIGCVLAAFSPSTMIPVLAGALFATNVWLARSTLKQWATFPAIAIWLAIASTVGVFSFTIQMRHPDWQNIFIETGYLHMDLLYHSALAGQLQSHEVLTTGIEGLASFHYHVTSHWIMGHLSAKLDIPIMDAYHTGYIPFFLPLIFFALSVLVLSAIRVSEILGRRTEFNPTIMWIGVWLVLAGVLPYRVGFAYTYQFFSVFVSESYGFSVVILCLATAALLPTTIRAFNSRKFDSSFFICLTTYIALLGIAGSSKISVPFVVLPVLGWMLIRSKVPLKWIIGYATLSIGTLIVCYMAFGYRGAGDGIQWALPLLRFKESPSLLFLGAWIFIYLTLRATFERFDIKSIWARNFVDVEFLFLLLLMGLIPTLFLRIAGGSEIYFIEVALWFAAPATVAYVSIERQNLSLLWKLVLIQFVLHGVGNTLKIGANHVLFEQCVGGALERCGDFENRLGDKKRDDKARREVLLKQLLELKNPEFQNYGVFVTNDSFLWDIHPDPRFTALLVPGLTQKTLYGGMKHINAGPNFFGFDSMESHRSSSPTNAKQALHKACQDGLEGVLVLGQASKDHTVLRCKPSPISTFAPAPHAE